MNKEKFWVFVFVFIIYGVLLSGAISQIYSVPELEYVYQVFGIMTVVFFIIYVVFGWFYLFPVMMFIYVSSGFFWAIYRKTELNLIVGLLISISIGWLMFLVLTRFSNKSDTEEEKEIIRSNKEIRELKREIRELKK